VVHRQILQHGLLFVSGRIRCRFFAALLIRRQTAEFIDETRIYGGRCSILKALTLQWNHSYSPAAGDHSGDRLSSGTLPGIQQQIHFLVTLAQMPAYAFERMEQEPTRQHGRLPEANPGSAHVVVMHWLSHSIDRVRA
jgi:hypothetical protein